MGVVREILEWTQGLPPWQSDAVSRLFNKQILDAEDIEDLLAILKAEHGLPDPKDRKAVPLSPDKIPAKTEPTDHIELLAIKNLKNVNAIAEDQRLEFSPEGLTIVYGDNGSGKSGYTRVLKKACRARDQEEAILPNAKLPSLPGEKAEAILEINHNGIVIDETWRNGEATPDLLSDIAIFDQRCARAYLDNEDDFQFVPYGLDILNNLATLFNQLKERLDVEKGQCVVDLDIFNELRGSTEVGKLIESISSKTDIKKVETLSTLTTEEVSRHQGLNKSLNEEDPKVKADQIRRQANRFSRLATRASEVQSLLNDEVLLKLKNTDSEYQVAKTAANLAAKKFEEESHFLAGTGGPVWKSLFEAAQKFSEEAYPEKPFPNVEPGALCPLCQQALEEGGGKHLAEFNEYIQQEAERVAAEKLEALNQAKSTIEAVNASLALDDEVLAEIASIDEKLSEDTRAYAKSIDIRHEQMKNAFGLNNWDEVDAISDNPAQQLHQKVKTLNGEVETLEKAADDKTRLSLEEEFKELDYRVKLGIKKGALLDAIGKMVHHDKISKCISSVNTRAVSNKVSELTEKVVSKELESALNSEFKALMVGNLEVALISRPHKGKALHKLKLNLPQAVKKLGDILSEGEQRAVAIASFLAEINVSGSTGAIVFDDPVSSLDHRRRERVAKRLVEEGKNRQVIIFTHDIYFLGLLEHEAAQAKLTLNTQSLSQRRAGYGVVEPELPFRAKKTTSRIGELRALHQEIDKIYRTGDEPVHREKTLCSYGLLRDTWERAVEEVLFGDVVVRYRKGVQTNQLRNVVVELSDYEAVDKGISKCSNYRHDNPALAGISVPDPDELLADIEELEKWRTELVTRKENTNKARK